jgi:hypothetical protein
MKTALKYGAALIALYLGVEYASGSEGLVKTTLNSGSNLVKTFQGR